MASSHCWSVHMEQCELCSHSRLIKLVILAWQATQQNNLCCDPETERSRCQTQHTRDCCYAPQCKCRDFENFANTWEFTYIITSLRYPQSNGLAEKYVQIAKSLMEKARADQRDPFLRLLEYRNTPVDRFKSPAQLLMNLLWSILPSTHQQLQFKVVSHRDFHARSLTCKNM